MNYQDETPSGFVFFLCIFSLGRYILLTNNRHDLRCEAYIVAGGRRKLPPIAYWSFSRDSPPSAADLLHSTVYTLSTASCSRSLVFDFGVVVHENHADESAEAQSVDFCIGIGDFSVTLRSTIFLRIYPTRTNCIL